MTKIKSDIAKVLVCQRGARHRYAIPKLLEEAGMLAALYTDSTRYSDAGQIAQNLGKIGVKSPRIMALSARIPKGVPRKKVFCTDKPLHASMTRGMVEDDLSPVFKKWGLKDANVVYSMCGEDFRFLEWAKNQGAKIIIDVFVHPGTARIIEAETLSVTGKKPVTKNSASAIEDHFKRSFKLADIILCPSNWVANGVREHAPEFEDKIRVVPYGSSLHLKDAINESPAVGNVFFAGREPIRKGIHYLASAAKKLRDANVSVDVRLAGVSKENIEWMEHHNELNCLGTLPMNKMHHEFDTADVFVLPSLSEGQAGVLLEAMASGCPVIATRESGVDFRPGCGITIPVRNVNALAEAIEEVVCNRETRKSLAEGALRQAKEFSMDAWKERLVEVIHDVVTQ